MYAVHGTSAHPASSSALLSDGPAIVFSALGVWEIVTAVLGAVLGELFRHVRDVLLRK